MPGPAAQPDATGHFGPYGGRFVPETLVARARRARARVRPRAGRRGLPPRARRDAARLRGPADAADRGEASLGGGRLPRVPQARGPAPHRRAQDQQHDRPVPARATHGQAARHRRDGRRPARRRDGGRGRALRARVRRLHGHRGRAPAEAERRAHAAAGRRGARGGRRLEDAQGRDQRGAARLGDARARHALRARLGAGARTRSRASCATSTA